MPHKISKYILIQKQRTYIQVIVCMNSIFNILILYADKKKQKKQASCHRPRGQQTDF